MAQTIDKLQVEIEASAKGVSQVFTQIQNQLKTIQSVMKSINTSNLTKLSKATNVSVNTSGVTKAQRDISNSVSKIQQSLSGLESYKNAALGGDSSSLTSFNRRVISIQSSIDTLKTKMQQLGITQIESPAFTSLKTQSDALETKLTSLQTQMNNVLSGNTTMSSTAFSQLTDDIKNTSAELQSVESQMQNMTLGGTAYVNADSLSTQLDSAKSEVDAFVDDVNSKKPSLDTSGITISLSDVISNAKTAASKLLELSSSAIKSGFSGIASSLSKIKSTLSGIGSSASKASSTGFSKILKYGFGIRSMYVLFRRLRSAIKDAFTELQTSGAFFETTNANVDALSNSLSTLKYQFGAAFEPIFNTIAPALQTLINYLVAVMNTISAFIAKLTGASTYSKAVVSTAAIADNTGSAASSAEDLNKQLQGFDELNNLSGDDDSGSGGSGSSSSDDSTVTYVEESVESALTSFWDSLYDAISSGDWWKVGNLISEELTSALNSIDWTSIFQTASDFGTNFASFLNGLISDDLFSAVGTTIANSIKTALYAALSFSEKFSWSGLGSAIASGINAIMDAEPLSLAVDTANSWINGILESLVTAVNKISWSTLSTHIADAIGSIDASGFGEGLGNLASGIANALYTLVSNKDTWTNLGTKIGEGISSFFKSMNTVNGSTGKTGWQALGGTISSTISGIGTVITSALENVNWEDVGKGIADFISSINWKSVWFTFTGLLDALKEAIKGILTGANISLGDVVVAIAGIGVVISAITAVSLGASIAKATLVMLIQQKLLGLLGGSGATITLGSIGLTLGTVALTIAATIVGWKIGEEAYETATGESYPSFSEIISTLFSENSLSDLWNGFKLDLETDGEITLDLAKTMATVVGLPTVGIDALSVSPDMLTIDASKSKTNNKSLISKVKGMLDEAEEKLVSDAEKMGIHITDGVITGIDSEALKKESWRVPAKDSFEAFIDAVAEQYGIDSPAKNVMYLGEYIHDGLVEGFKSKFDDFKEAIKSLKDKVVGWLEEKFDGFDVSDYIDGWSSTNVTVSATLGTPKSTLKGWGDAFNKNITSKWVNTNADVDANLGGDLEDNGIGTFSIWETIFSNFKEKWTGAKATFKANTGGELSSINDLPSWQSLISGLTSAWTSKTATFTAGYGSGTSSNSIGSMKSVISGLTGAWFGKSASFSAGYQSGTNANSINSMKSTIVGLTGAWVGKTATFGAGYASGTSADSINKMKGVISPLVSAWIGKSASFSASFNQSLGTMQGYADAAKSIYENWVGRDATFNIWANIDSNVDSFASQLVDSINSKLNKTTTWKFSKQAMGGVLTSAGWKSIPQYAGGTLNTGSLFFAGEQSGNPELVGHVNGRTEVLNKSQLASVMYASVGQALRNFGSLASPPTLTANGYSANGITGASGKASSDALIMEQNRLLERQNMLLEQIASKDNTISVNDIFGAMQSANNDYFNRTGNSAFVF